MKSGLAELTFNIMLCQRKIQLELSRPRCQSLTGCEHP